MKTRFVFAALAGALSLPAAAQSCYVTAQTSGAVPPPVAQERCFEYRGVDSAEALEWSCRDTDAVRNEQRRLRDSCPSGAVGACTARMTPESLISDRAKGSQAHSDVFSGQIPENAEVVTHYYKVTDLAQARIDCEGPGGQWHQPQ